MSGLQILVFLCIIVAATGNTEAKDAKVGPTIPESCIAPNGKICNGHGNCHYGPGYGVCVCHRNSKYRGRTCEDCPSCPGRCELTMPCVMCVVWGRTDKLTTKECRYKCQHVEMVDKVQSEDSVEWHVCRFRDREDGCYGYFAYHRGGSIVRADKIKECFGK